MRCEGEASLSLFSRMKSVAHRLRASLIFGLNNETALITGSREWALALALCGVFATGGLRLEV